MLIARDLTLRRGPEPLFERVNFTVFRGDKVGLTGANGSGKSSLFAAIRAELGPDRGEIELPAALKIAHVEQEIASLDRAAIDFVLDGDTELCAVMAAIEDAERRDSAMELAEHYAALQAIDGYRARARAAAIMHGLGFKAAEHERKVAEFSGGWRVRLAMARAQRNVRLVPWPNPAARRLLSPRSRRRVPYRRRARNRWQPGRGRQFLAPRGRFSNQPEDRFRRGQAPAPHGSPRIASTSR